MNKFRQRMAYTMIQTVIGVLFFLYIGIPDSPVKFQVDRIIAMTVLVIGAVNILIIREKESIYKWMGSSPDNLPYLWKMVMKFHPYMVVWTDTDNEVKASECLPITNEDMLEKLALHLNSQQQLESICMKLKFSHLTKWRNFKAVKFMLSLLLISSSVTAQDTISRITVSPFFGGTALIQDDITMSSADAETGIITGIETIYNFNVPLYVSVSSGYDSYSFNELTSFKGTFIEVSAGAVVLSEWPWQVNIGPYWRNSYSNGRRLQQWGIRPSISYKRFSLTLNTGWYEYERLSSMGGSIALGYRICLGRNAPTRH